MTNPKTSAISANALKACNLFTSKEDARYYLQGVLLTITARAAVYVATDGHRLLARREELNEGADANTLLGSWIIPSEAITKAKTTKYTVQGTLSELDGRLALAFDGVETVTRPIDGTFPDWRRVLPAALDPAKAPQRVQFNTAYLADFGKASKLLFDSPLKAHFHYGDADMPCAVTFGDDRTFGVIMPVRSSADLWAGAPAWVNENPDAAALKIAAE